MKVVVGMSGGVDSSVAALLLKEQGHEVRGITMSTWEGSSWKSKIALGLADSAIKKSSCFGPDEEEDLEKAAQVCKSLEIPLHVFDCSKEYETIVLDYFRREYASGRTPNPCVRCNHLIKFGALPKIARQSGLEFDCFATGHYARVGRKENNSRFLLMRSLYAAKDQSYFLYRLSQEQLAGLLLPLGELTKEEVREIARKHDLPVSEREESQDFYGGNYQDLLQLGKKEGNIVDTKGNVLGKHQGTWHYTLGQRKGLGIAHSEPLYVVRLDAASNTVVVGTKEEVYESSFIVADTNWVAIEQLSESLEVTVKVRSAHKEVAAIISPLDNGGVSVKLAVPQDAITPGQSAVFYQGDVVVGGGIIKG